MILFSFPTAQLTRGNGIVDFSGAIAINLDMIVAIYQPTDDANISCLELSTGGGSLSRPDRVLVKMPYHRVLSIINDANRS